MEKKAADDVIPPQTGCSALSPTTWPQIHGRFSKKNRLQVYFSLVLFSFGAWFALHPLDFHPLDGFSFILHFGFSSILGAVTFSESIGSILSIAILLTLPFLLLFYFRTCGFPYFAWLTLFWFAYYAQFFTRVFHSEVYRLPALLSFLASLTLLVLGLFGSLAFAEDRFFPNPDLCPFQPKEAGSKPEKIDDH